MSDLKANVIMPSSDYKAICDAVRAKTGSTELLKSGELAEVINGIGEKTFITDMSYFCSHGYRVNELNKIDTSKSTSFYGTFINCDGYTSFPDIDTSSGIDFRDMFHNCYSLVSSPNIDTSNGTLCNNMFLNCSSLVSIPSLDLNSATTSSSVNKMFSACSKLKNLYLHNIRVSITLSNNTSYGTLLTVDSLVNTIKELCTVSSSQTLTMGSTNLAKISDLYCRVTDDTTEKKPMELCDSTAEGTMTLSAYAALKNWTLA